MLTKEFIEIITAGVRKELEIEAEEKVSEKRYLAKIPPKIVSVATFRFNPINDEKVTIESMLRLRALSRRQVAGK